MRNYRPIKLIQLSRETGLPFTLMLKRARELNICPSKNLVLTEIDALSAVTDEKDEHLIIPSKMNTNV
jgi:hypothetical protein